MKLLPRFVTALCALGLAATASAANWTEGMKAGKPEIKSVNQLAFGPDGILFLADSKSAAVFAVDTGDAKAGPAGALKVEGINQKIAALLGTSADQILITDMVVNPISRNAYIAVARGRSADAAPALFRVDKAGKLEAVSLDNVKHAKAQLPDAPIDGVVGDGKRKSNPRMESITDIAFLEDRLLIAGMSNEEFASTLRAIPFPFKSVANGTSVEIYHGAHGKFETRSPVRTFIPFKVGKEQQLLAAYTCTPLVQFPLKDLKPGAKIQGKTIAELGNRNRPLDMIVYQKDGKDYLLIANNARGIMKIDTSHIEGADSITTKVDDKKGVTYETIQSWAGVDQLDRLDDKTALVMRRNGEGDAAPLTLESLPLP